MNSNAFAKLYKATGDNSFLNTGTTTCSAAVTKVEVRSINFATGFARVAASSEVKTPTGSGWEITEAKLELGCSLMPKVLESTNPFEILGFINACVTQQGKKLPTTWPGAPRYDLATATETCRCSGYKTMASYGNYSATYGMTGYNSAKNNGLYYFDTASQTWYEGNAKTLGNKWLGYLKCTEPVACQ